MLTDSTLRTLAHLCENETWITLNPDSANALLKYGFAESVSYKSENDGHYRLKITNKGRQYAKLLGVGKND